MHIQFREWTLSLNGTHCGTAACHATPVCLSQMLHMLQGVPVIYQGPARVSDRHPEYSQMKSAFIRMQLILCSPNTLRGEKIIIIKTPHSVTPLWKISAVPFYTTLSLSHLKMCVRAHVLITTLKLASVYLPPQFADYLLTSKHPSVRITPHYFTVVYSESELYCLPPFLWGGMTVSSQFLGLTGSFLVVSPLSWTCISGLFAWHSGCVNTVPK